MFFMLYLNVLGWADRTGKKRVSLCLSQIRPIYRRLAVELEEPVWHLKNKIAQGHL